jgi:hypothetical protein
MVAVAVAGSSVEVDRPSAVAERLEAFGVEVLAEAVNRPVQLVNGGVYLRGFSSRGRVSLWSRWSRGWARRLTMRACRTSWR